MYNKGKKDLNRLKKCDSRKCPFGEIYRRGNVIRELSFGEMSVWGIVRRGNVFLELSIGEKSVGEMSVRELS